MTSMEEPSASARLLARFLRDQFVAMQAEGFTQDQTIQLLAHVIRIAIENQGKQDQ